MKILPSKFIIKVYNQKHSEAVQDRLFELGKSWFFGSKTYLSPQHGTFYIIVDKSEIMWDEENRGDYGPCLTIDDLYNSVVYEPETVSLDGDDAVINLDKVVIGDITISFDKILEIFRAVERAQNVLDKMEK